MQSRREFIFASAAVAATLIAPRRAHAMVMQQENTGAANVPMEQDAYRPVSLAAKPNTRPSMTDEQRDELEHHIKCQCGCVLDVYTCRTTDFSCSVSPAMHSDVMNLVSKGYNGTEILAAFQGVYGERVLMAPLKQGFNLVGYIMPFAALGGAAIVVAGLIRKWGRKAALSPQPAGVSAIDATPAEMEALDAALRDDS
jgi:cytochrome c-type biogenesis protein CcmH